MNDCVFSNLLSNLLNEMQDFNNLDEVVAFCIVWDIIVFSVASPTVRSKNHRAENRTLMIPSPSIFGRSITLELVSFSSSLLEPTQTLYISAYNLKCTYFDDYVHRTKLYEMLEMRQV